jgi:hypothetical protein
MARGAMKSDGPVDLVHLDRYTGGDRGLNVEILSLFDGQCQEMVARLARMANDVPDAKEWKLITHSLKGAARGIGAFALADAAAAAEPVGNDRALVMVAVQEIRDRSTAVQQFIVEFVKRAGEPTP